MSQKFPTLTDVNLTKTAESQGISYATGMILVYGTTGGLPDFAEIVQIVVHDCLVFVVKLQSVWYCEHYQCFKLESTGIVKVIEQSQLTDTYPLSAYTVDGDRTVSLKYYVCCSN